MPRNYYCLVSGLPEISLDQNKLSFTQLDFKSELQEIMHPKDFNLIELFFLHIDNRNLLNLLLKKEVSFIEGGKYSQGELEDEIKDPAAIESYLITFINAFKDEIPIYKGVSWENQLTTLFYDYVLSFGNDFVKGWFTYEMLLNNLITALNCRKYNIDPEQELIRGNELVDSLLKSTTKDFGLSSEIPYIDKLVQLFESDDIKKRELDVDIMKWDYLDEITVFEYFTTEKVLSYFIKLSILERWVNLDIEAGKELFDKFVKDLELSYEFPKEYVL